MFNQLPDNIRMHIEQQKGDLLNGYIRFLNEDEIAGILAITETSTMWEGGIPFATTAFADVLVWSDGYVMLYKFSEADYNVILSGTTFFLENINDASYQEEYFDMALYLEAVEKCGYVAGLECYTLEPIPALGGAREIAYVHVGDMKTYLNMLVEFA